jgi:predicted nucleic acid-binding protein
MSGRYVLDSNIIMDLFNGVEGVEFLKDKLPLDEQFISVITRIELLAFDNLSSEDERSIRLFLSHRTIVPLNEAVENNAILLRRKTSLKMPDAIIAATALTLDATIISRDDHLLGLAWPGLSVISGI